MVLTQKTNMGIQAIANGNLGHSKILPKELAKIRKKETEKAAKIIGAEYVGIDIGDLKVNSYDPDTQKKVVELIQYTKPDLIITHDPNDYMPDHIETSKLVFHSSFCSSIPNYKTKKIFFETVSPIFYMETVLDIGFVPKNYVDISETIDLKIKAINCHKSQIEWLSDHDGFDMVKATIIAGEYRGMQSNVKFAEVFRQCWKWPRITTKRLLP